jgi:NADP-dependent 3-hydroxy acid dehydrogenase YdfG
MPVAVVTGAGTGIGKATAAQFIKAGPRSKVLCVSRDFCCGPRNKIGFQVVLAGRRGDVLEQAITDIGVQLTR